VPSIVQVKTVPDGGAVGLAPVVLRPSVPYAGKLSGSNHLPYGASAKPKSGTHCSPTKEEQVKGLPISSEATWDSYPNAMETAFWGILKSSFGSVLGQK
jgi:hypothetical protein